MKTTMPAKKVIIAIILVVALVGGLIVGLILVRQRQDIRKEASTPTGQATVSVSPATGTIAVGQSQPVTVSFNTAGIAISAVAVRLTYSYTGSTPELTAAQPQINTALTSTGNWSCPVKSVSDSGLSVIHIDIACAYTDPAGFTSSTDTPLATVNLTANSLPSTNPVVLRFDTAQSVITQKSTAEDILLTPTSTGTFTIASGSGGTQTPTPTNTATPSPTPTAPAGGGTASPTPTGTKTASPTPTPTKTASPTPTPTKTASPTPGSTSTASATPMPIPETGVSLPLVMGLAVGLLLLAGAAFLVI